MYPQTRRRRSGQRKLQHHRKKHRDLDANWLWHLLMIDQARLGASKQQRCADRCQSQGTDMGGLLPVQ